MSTSRPPLSPDGSGSAEDRLDQAIAEYMVACESLEPPDQASFLEKYSDVAEELREFFEQRDQLDQLVRPIRGLQSFIHAGSLADEGPIEFGDYILQRELGRGGMGIIYDAMHGRLKRRVALKMIAGLQFATGNDVRRFQAEAEAAATLEHPNIIPIYEVGEVDDRPYFTMKLVDGGSLRDTLKDGALPPRVAASLTMQLAQAVHYAHQRGVLHRDLKPANILLDAGSSYGDSSHETQPGGVEDAAAQAPNRLAMMRSDATGQLVSRQEFSIIPLISDFGLAKRMNSDDGLTKSGAMLGTPSFMAPEQAAGRPESITVATDVYGLGGILYNMLAGRAPFSGDTPLAVTRRVIEDPPDSIRRSNSQVDLDLETICLKCLEKEPHQRYESALDLADDLQRYLEGVPILARRSGALEQLTKWARRKPAQAGLLMVVALASVGIVVGLFVSNRLISAEQTRTSEALNQVQEEQQATAEALTDLQQQQAETNQALWESYVNEAAALRQAGKQSASAAALDQAARLDDRIDFTDEQTFRMRNELIAGLALPLQLRLTHHRTNRGVFEMDREVNTNADVTLLVSSRQNGTVKIWDIESDREMTTIPLDAYQSRMSPDGRSLALAHGEGLWLSRLELDGSLLGEPISLADVGRIRWHNFDFTPDGRFVVLGGPNATEVTVCDAVTGAVARKIELAPATFLRFNRDGTLLAGSESNGREVTVIDFHAGTHKQHWKFDDQTFDVAFRPGSTQLACGLRGGRIQVMDWKTGREVRQLDAETQVVERVFYDSAGAFLLSTDWNETTKIWHAETGELLLSVAGETIGVSRNGSRIAIRHGNDIDIYDLQASAILLHGDGHQSQDSLSYRVYFHPWLPLSASSGQDGARIVHTITRKEMAYLPLGDLRTAIFHPRDGSLVTAGESGLLRWPLSHDKMGVVTFGPWERLPLTRRAPADHVAISRNGKRLVVDYVGIGYPADVIDWEHRDSVMQLGEHPGNNGVAISPDARHAATGNWKGRDAVIWDCDTGEEHARIQSDLFQRIAYSPDGRWFATASSDATRIYDTDTYHLQRQLPPSQATPSFSPDGSTVALILPNKSIGLFDVESKQQLASLTETPNPLVGRHLQFSHDGQWLGREGGMRPVSAWNIARLRKELNSRELDWQTVSQSDAKSLSDVDYSQVTDVVFQLSPRYQTNRDQFGIRFGRHATWPLSNNLHNDHQDLSFANLQVGWHDFGGVYFQIDERMLREGTRGLLIDADAADQASLEVPVGRAATKLHVLHGVIFDVRSKVPPEIASYVIHYADGSVTEFKVDIDRNISELRRPHDLATLSEAQVAWLGVAPGGEVINVSRATWENPHPDKEIQSIQLRLADDAHVDVFCLAITGE